MRIRFFFIFFFFILQNSFSQIDSSEVYFGLTLKEIVSKRQYYSHKVRVVLNRKDGSGQLMGKKKNRNEFIKYDNYFQLIEQFNPKAFKNARLQSDYVDTIFNELEEKNFLLSTLNKIWGYNLDLFESNSYKPSLRVLSENFYEDYFFYLNILHADYGVLIDRNYLRNVIVQYIHSGESKFVIPRLEQGIKKIVNLSKQENSRNLHAANNSEIIEKVKENILISETEREVLARVLLLNETIQNFDFPYATLKVSMIPKCEYRLILNDKVFFSNEIATGIRIQSDKLYRCQIFHENGKVCEEIFRAKSYEIKKFTCKL